jgi:mono/diheme cytochrome c family protein
MLRHRHPARCTAIAILLLATAAPAGAGDVAAGRRKALACQACHGLDGLSKLPDAPHLAGQPERYLVKSLDEYRKGVRKNELMTLVVKDPQRSGHRRSRVLLWRDRDLGAAAEVSSKSHHMPHPRA